MHLDFEAFLDHLAITQKSPLTVRRYGEILRDLDAFPGATAPHALTTEQLRRFAVAARHDGRPRAAAGVNLRVAALRAAFGFLFAERGYASDPTVRLRGVPEVRRTPKYLTNAEVRVLLDHVGRSRGRHRKRNVALVVTLWQTALRVRELASLSADQLDRATALLRGVRVKGGHVLDVVLNDETLAILDEYLGSRGALRPDAPLFSRIDGKRLSVRAIQALFETWRSELGWTRPLHPHVLRHTHATGALALGVDIATVAELLRHKGLGTVLVYAVVQDAARRQALAKLGALVPREVLPPTILPGATVKPTLRSENVQGLADFSCTEGRFDAPSGPGRPTASTSHGRPTRGGPMSNSKKTRAQLGARFVSEDSARRRTRQLRPTPPMVPSVAGLILLAAGACGGSDNAVGLSTAGGGSTATTAGIGGSGGLGIATGGVGHGGGATSGSSSVGGGAQGGAGHGGTSTTSSGGAGGATTTSLGGSDAGVGGGDAAAGGGQAADAGMGGAGGAPCVPTPEVCDGVDNDCDGIADEGCACVNGTTQFCYTGPANTQGVGECGTGVHTCDAGAWGSCLGEILPVVEVCDGKDNDCNDKVDDGNPGGGKLCDSGKPGLCGPGTTSCIGGVVVCVSNALPQAEMCNGKDDNCNGQTDENDPGGGVACDTKKPGVCKDGVTHCQAGALACVQSVKSSPEICDGKDNDCDGIVDNGVLFGSSCYTNLPGECSSGQEKCQAGSYVCLPVTPPSPEQCNGKDDDCDGKNDSTDPDLNGAPCDTGLPGVCAAGTNSCTYSAFGYVSKCTSVTPASWEICNGLDDDCDGQVDNNCVACPNGKQVEICNGIDDDCDGVIDGAKACGLGKLCLNATCRTLPNNCTAWTNQGHGYAFCGNGATWTNARSQCDSYGAHLVTIGSADESTFVSGIAAGYQKDTWIGMIGGGSCMWFWESGEPVVYTAWGPGQPDGACGDQDCVQLWSVLNYAWDNNWCGASRSFICEWDQ